MTTPTTALRAALADPRTESEIALDTAVERMLDDIDSLDDPLCICEVGRDLSVHWSASCGLPTHRARNFAEGRRAAREEFGR